MSLPQTLIRDKFVIAFVKRRQAAWKMRWRLIEDRDAKGREINKAFGVVEADGSIPSIPRLPRADYRAQFDALEADFKAKYEAIPLAESQANRDDGMTVWEYLLLDEIHDDQLYLDAASGRQNLDWLRVKAKDEIEHVRHHTFGNVKRLIKMRKSWLPFAAKRCRNALGISLLDIAAQAAILKFRLEFGRAISRQLDDLPLS